MKMVGHWSGQHPLALLEKGGGGGGGGKGEEGELQITILGQT